MSKQTKWAGARPTAMLGFALSFVLGCGEDSPFQSVSGVVTLDGKPVPEATVAFIPDESDCRPAFGTTKTDGTYELSTLKSGDGAHLGCYRVTITAVDLIESEKAKAIAEKFGSLSGDMPMPPPRKVWRVPQTYSEAKTSGLEFTVEPGNNTADFALTK